MQPCLPEELTEIYSTPTPRVGVSQKSKDMGLCLIDGCLLQQPGFNIYTLGLTTSPGRTKPVTKLRKEDKTF